MGFLNKKIVTPGGIKDCAVGPDGAISVHDHLAGVDAASLVVPGYADLHVHFRDFEQKRKETVETGSLAALAGGACAVADMPNTSPPVADRGSYFLRKKLFEDTCACDYLINFCAYDEYSLSQAASVDPFFIKVYLGETTGSYVLDPSLLERVFMLGKPIAIHAGYAGMKEALKLSARYSTQLHICHVSTKEEVELIAGAKTPLVTCEVTPHHLFLEGDYPVKPPLAGERDRKALWNALGNVIDIVASDHAPHTLEDKAGGAYGVSGIETTVPLMVDAMLKKVISPETLYSCMHGAQASLLSGRGIRFGLFDGSRSDFAVVGTDSIHAIDPSEFRSKAKHSPFEGMEVAARVEETWVRGKKRYFNGTFDTGEMGMEMGTAI